MKFICPSCQAKYQIADEKVQGRSVRMKCRKCGHVINIGDADTLPRPDTAVSLVPSADLPSTISSSEAVSNPNASNPIAATSPVPKVQAPPPRRPVAPSAGKSSPGAAGLPPTPRTTGAAKPPPRAGAIARPGPTAVPARAVPNAPSSPTTTAKAGVGAGALASANRGAKGVVVGDISPAGAGGFGTSGSGPGGSSRALAGALEAEGDSPGRVSSVGALAGAFAQAVVGGKAYEASPHHDEWFVGINGVPVGPIRLGELRSKASAGGVTSESLVWKEGFEEWLPLSRFPELLAIVEESLSSVRASLSPLEAPTPAIPSAFADPFAKPAASAAESDTELEALGVPPARGGLGAVAWIAMGVSIAFGLTLGFVLFGGQKEKEVVRIVEVPAEAGPGNPTSQNATETATNTTEEENGKKAVTSTGKAHVGATASTAKEATTGGITGLKGLSGLKGLGPASGTPGENSAAAGSGHALDSAQVQGVVSRYTASVKRGCWQPALDARDKDAPTTARVAVTITVGASGSVSNATTSGDPKGYRGLSNCIAGRVRGWQFPPSSGTTTVQVPFVFAAQ